MRGRHAGAVTARGVAPRSRAPGPVLRWARGGCAAGAGDLRLRGSARRRGVLALGYVDPPVPPGFDSWDAFDASLPVERQGSSWACQEPEGAGPRLFFQRVPEAEAVKNRLHLDVRVGVGLVGDERVRVLEAEAARLVGLGARRLHLLPADEEDESCLVVQDVEGDESFLD